MKKKIFYILPILFIGISSILIYQTRNTRNDYRKTVESSSKSELSPFEQLQQATSNDLVDLGKAMISFVQFIDSNEATITTEKEELKLPLTIKDSETNQFSLETLESSPELFVIGDTFGLAVDDHGTYYYYPLE
ncbi:hypothetical protein [Enterococcus sp. DIV0385]|uniref:hypothetical protein n=1 Tax=Enterococcus sp. DIV0385 TaxID=2775003 RepID=UPI000A34C43D|nr:hypothetical protein A5852_003484 [Enterococcus faecium]